jgi:small-conductance mechanosensitive channel
MKDWLDLGILALAVVVACCGFIARVRAYRPLIWGGAVLATLTALHPRPGNGLAILLFGEHSAALPAEFFGVVWWVLGAWLVKGVLDIFFRRTLFPHDDQPHARRLFADLIFIVVYLVAFFGIIDTVFKQSISAVLATSGVLAVVLGLALQNTLADVFAGLALNVDRPFASGDWITLTDHVEGQVMEINWRATRLKTASNSIVNIPNSVIAKAIVTNHRPLTDPYYCTIEISVDHSVPPSRVINALTQAASSSDDVPPCAGPTAYACSFSDSIIVYQLSFVVADFPNLPIIRSAVIARVTETLVRMGIPIGAPIMDIHIVRRNAPITPKDPLGNGVRATPSLMPKATAV